MLVKHTIRCLGPMSHGSMGGDTGNVMLFRRIPMSRDGVVVQIPAISAGALRGVIRRALWREVFAAVGLSRETFDGVGSWDRLYAALCNGGTIESAESRVSPDTIRARRAALPVLSLLGSALYSSYMAGRAKVTNSWLLCSEAGTGDRSCWDLLAEESRVRHIDSEEQDPDVSKVGPMPTTVETVIAGSSFGGRTHVAGDLEASAWAHGLDIVTHLGGKSGQGYGECEITHDGDGDLYREWLAANVEPLRAALMVLASELGEGKKKKSKTMKVAKVEQDESMNTSMF